MTGSWLAIVQGFAGMRVREDRLHFAPFLPKSWNAYQFRINFRGRIIQVHVSSEGTKLTLVTGQTLTVYVYGQPTQLEFKIVSA
jgi:maltose phosphorylase